MEARLDAKRWSTYLSAHIHELGHIAGGEERSPEAEGYLSNHLKGNFLKSFRVYDNTGELKLNSDSGGRETSGNIADFDPLLAASLKAGNTATSFHELSKGGIIHPSRPLLFPSRKMGIASAGWS
jgi:hypothetical protein